VFKFRLSVRFCLLSYLFVLCIYLIYKDEVVSVCSLIARARIYQSAPNLAYLFLEITKKFWKSKNSKKLSLVRVPMRADRVTRKLSLIEERRKDQSCLLGRLDYKTIGHSPEKVSCVRIPVGAVPVTRKLSKIEERH
jgi:hypothetical protein